MKKYFDGKCDNPKCTNNGIEVEVLAEEVENGTIVGASCEKCRESLRHMFSTPPAIDTSYKGTRIHGGRTRDTRQLIRHKN
ncbi:hypothetical protein KKF55_03140 [Patescibacteria group bacterium]|nr:hypothetical protein [Patescibacteria group bacterium]